MSKRRPADDVQIEDVAGRLRRVLAAPGPHDDHIGHHRTYAGNTDPSKRTLAVCSAAPTEPATVHILRWRACGR